MDFNELLFAAEARALASNWLGQDVPDGLDGEARRQWRRENLDTYILRAAKELKRVAEVIRADQAAE
ncbi:hypothetical protein OU994_18095 [Pseudoduganella sp. SL102]|uniref:hypothetical protein n=1 Tax=Pseudoduganella sp. SL102 TaxID=2995154 RepID=UPI00248AFD64|nr:hypothetical protein [Pseudoduganella sp. SL102]WBS00233.1 hypothetical protein OU994_18095 [Pseudoduganella sp. SL102]